MKHDYLDALKAFEDNRFYDEWDVNFPHKETIIHALRFAEKMCQEPSERMLAEAEEKDVLYHKVASADDIFKAMRGGALKELGE